MNDSGAIAFLGYYVRPPPLRSPGFICTGTGGPSWWRALATRCQEADDS